jgi:hypothetical protein
MPHGSTCRARCVPDGTVRDGHSRSLADKRKLQPPGLMQVIARTVSAFQAGHEGSIPFARSTEKYQVKVRSPNEAVVPSVGQHRFRAHADAFTPHASRVPWTWPALTDIHHQGFAPGRMSDHGEHGEEAPAPPCPLRADGCSVPIPWPLVPYDGPAAAACPYPPRWPRLACSGTRTRHREPRARICGSWSCHRGSSMSAQAASHNVLTVTRMLFRAEDTGGQNQKLPLPSSPGKPRQSPGMPSCSSPASSTART